MELEEDSLRNDQSEGMSSIIQNISALSMTLYPKEEEGQVYVFPPVSSHVKNERTEIRDQEEESFPDFPDSNIEPYEENVNDKKLKIIKVEVEFLKQSIEYLQSILSQKSLKVANKDEKIEKLDKVIEKQKKKLKDLKNRMKFQGCKLAQLEARIPAYLEMAEKNKAVFGEKKSAEGVLGKISLKKSKVSSIGPKLKDVPPLKQFSPRN